jgi:hypothetical protein
MLVPLERLCMVSQSSGFFRIRDSQEVAARADYGSGTFPTALLLLTGERSSASGRYFFSLYVRNLQKEMNTKR